MCLKYFRAVYFACFTEGLFAFYLLIGDVLKSGWFGFPGERRLLILKQKLILLLEKGNLAHSLPLCSTLGTEGEINAGAVHALVNKQSLCV